MSNIDWSKAPKNAIGKLFTKETNIHHPQSVFASEVRRFGCMIRGRDCNGDTFSAPDDCWEWADRPVEPWTGEGLPPVGTVCEFKANILGWVQSTITAVTELSIVFTRPSYQNGRPLVEERLPHKAIERFRPILTPEQIEARNREEAITHIATIMGKDPERPSIREKAAIIYDAGYRKVTP